MYKNLYTFLENLFIDFFKKFGVGGDPKKITNKLQQITTELVAIDSTYYEEVNYTEYNCLSQVLHI